MKRLFACLLLCAMLMALMPLSAAEESAVYKPLQHGDDGEMVSQVQQLLSDLGYFSGNITGKFRDETEKAVRRFQRDYGLEATGVVDGETEVLLLNAEYRGLVYGDDGDDVTALQQRLKDLGYLSAKATGKFRDATAAAVKAFQKQNSLEQTGEADIETQRVLFSRNALAKGATPTPRPAPGSDLGDVTDMVIAGDGEAMPETAFPNKLMRGDKGETVKQVQRRLKELGFFDGPVSGNYMDQTIAAVKAFQEHNGLYTSDILNEETWHMLFNTADVLDVMATARPTPVPTPVPYAITVDVKNQVTIVYGRDDKGDYTLPVRRMICSTGTVATPSTVGDWVLSGRHSRWCYFPAYGSHAQYWTMINEYIAFHSVTYHEVDYNALNIKSYNRLGTRASHGCVRLLVDDARWVYENIGEGVVVTITETLPLDEELRRSVAAPPLNSAKTGPVETPVPTPPPAYTSDGVPPMPFETLRKGNESEAVYWLQMKLKELGYYNGTVTGGFYSGTEKAVKAFQKDHGITITGKANVQTLEKLYADVLPTPTPEPTATPAPTVP